jgi:hypothetical protein
MKIRSILILITLSLSIFSPLSVSITPSNNQSYILTLDVCHASGSAVSVSADIPALQESPHKLCPLGLCGYTRIIDPSCKLSLIASDLERPPKS